MKTVRQIMPLVLAQRGKVAPAAPRAADLSTVATRLAICLRECGRNPEQLCVLHCCGAQKLAVVAGWQLHRCGKKLWPS